MTKEEDVLEIQEKIVLTFDICSSTLILEDLHGSENLKAWRDFLIWIKRYLVKKSKEIRFDLYKFTGDGWILVFNTDRDGSDVVDFAKTFCNAFKKRFDSQISGLLESIPEVYGINFGMDRGKLVRVRMRNRDEFIGRPLNVACRLQSAIRDHDKNPQYKLLMPKRLHTAMNDDLSSYKFVEVKRTLRNVAGDKDFQCMKLRLLKRLKE
ncbi:MAG: hypothetical protein C4576_26895 [Desulfobacteraceae bacterium]|nr:MAG: hypothetical protein C4576_26895 [Desulfobacteraceae bacterium]